MKRACILCCILCLLLSGCSLRVPSGMNEDCFRLGLRAMGAADDYLDADATAIVASGQIHNVCKELSALPTDQNSDAQEVINYCEILAHMLQRAANGDTYAAEEILTARNNLARILEQEIR